MKTITQTLNTRSPKSCSIVLLWLLFFGSCKKHTFNEALPAVRTQAPTLYGQDSLILTGNITDKKVKTEYIGFCYDTVPNPALTTNQILGKGTAGNFSAVIPCITNKVYYIQAFAANELGYTPGNVVTYTFASLGLACAPCTLGNNTFHDNGSAFGVAGSGSSNNPSYGNYMTTVNGTNEDIYFCFDGVPHNGVYTTTADGSNISGTQVYVYISNFNQYVINSGQSLYVAVVDGQTTLSACSLTYGSKTLYGKVTY